MQNFKFMKFDNAKNTIINALILFFGFRLISGIVKRHMRPCNCGKNGHSSGSGSLTKTDAEIPNFLSPNYGSEPVVVNRSISLYTAAD